MSRVISLSYVGNGIAVDSSGNAFVTGETNSSNFPTVNPIRSSTSNFLKTLDSGGHGAVSSSVRQTGL